MVTINKQQAGQPDILLTIGVGENEANKSAYDSGQRNFQFKNSIYGDRTVKALLVQIQHDKCCFCERKISAGEPGHIEHYRPKGGYKINDQSKMVKPGYYWLAYSFENLYYCCNRCNTSYKKNYFPLADEGKRAINHHFDILEEDPLIIDPVSNPSGHLIFEREKLKAINGSSYGIETIKRTGLNRVALANERLEYLKLLDSLAIVARGNGPESQDAQRHFKRISKTDSLFSYMVVCNYPDLI